MATKTYDPKKIIVIFCGVQLSGFADGSFVSISPAAERFTKVVGADGEVGRAKSNDYTAEISITLAQTSISNDYLSSKLYADKVLGSGLGPLLVRDMNGTTLHFWPEAWIKQEADEEFGKELGDREWAFDTGQPADNNIGGIV